MLTFSQEKFGKLDASSGEENQKELQLRSKRDRYGWNRAIPKRVGRSSLFRHFRAAVGAAMRVVCVRAARSRASEGRTADQASAVHALTNVSY